MRAAGGYKVGPVLSDCTLAIQFSVDVGLLAQQTYNKLLSFITGSGSKTPVDSEVIIDSGGIGESVGVFNQSNWGEAVSE